MKRIIAILLTFVLVLSLCACGNKADKYVGTTWQAKGQGSNGELSSSLKFLSNGKVIALLYSPYSNLVTEHSRALYGEWQLEDNQIIVYIYEDSGYAIIFDIVDENTLTERFTYTRVK